MITAIRVLLLYFGGAAAMGVVGWLGLLVWYDTVKGTGNTIPMQSEPPTATDPVEARARPDPISQQIEEQRRIARREAEAVSIDPSSAAPMVDPNPSHR